MRVAQNIGLVLLFISVTFGVLLEDAFVKDWIKHSYGSIQQYDIISDHELIGITDFEQLVSIDSGSNGTLNWKVDLRELGSIDRYLLTKNNQQVYAYSSSGKNIYLYDTRSGILQERMVVREVPLQLVDFFGVGVVALGSNGHLTYVGNDGSILPIDTEGGIKEIKTSYADGIAYVITDRLSLVPIGVSLEVSPVTKAFKKYISNLNQIKDIKENIISTRDNRVLAIGKDGVVEVTHSLKSKQQIRLLNSEIAYVNAPNSIDFYKFTDGHLEALVNYPIEAEFSELDAINYSSSELILISTPAEAIILDVSGLSLGNDKNAIQRYSIGSNVLMDNSWSFFVDHKTSELQLISSVLTRELDITTYSVSNKSVKQVSVDMNNYYPTSSKSLIIDKPQSAVEFNKVHHLVHDTDGYNFFISRWISVVQRHLSQVGRFVVSKFISSASHRDVTANEDVFGFGKLIIFVDELQGFVIAMDSENGSRTWKCKIENDSQKLIEIIDKPITNEIVVVFSRSILSINTRNGDITSNNVFANTISKAFIVKSASGNDIIALKNTKNNKLQFFDGETNIKSDQYLIEQINNSVQGYSLNDGDLIPSWKFEKSHEDIILIKARPHDSKTSSIGIALFDKSVLYKYLYPNSISIITSDSRTKTLKFYLLDSITGSLLYTHEHDMHEIVDKNSIQLSMDDNWIVYTYFTTAPKVEQRVIVFDLFDTKEKSVNAKEPFSILENNSMANFISTKSFIFPERILSISSTQTRFGITLKSIIFLTETGSLIEVPKYILNSRRIANRELSSNDYQDDFRMMPYEPVIPKSYHQVLNHKHQLLLDSCTDKILIKPTELESTSVICFVNKHNSFCNVIQPSLSYDLLSENFDKFKLILTMITLLAAYLITQPFVVKKRLNSNWIDC